MVLYDKATTHSFESKVPDKYFFLFFNLVHHTDALNSDNNNIDLKIHEDLEYRINNKVVSLYKSSPLNEDDNPYDNTSLKNLA